MEHCPECEALVLLRAPDVIPSHEPGLRTYHPSRLPGYVLCWVSGLPIGEARDYVELRRADGGRLMRAAHP